MNISKFVTLSLLVALISLSGCKPESDTPVDVLSEGLQFNALRVEDGETFVDWTNGDQIGVTVIGHANFLNVLYQSEGSGKFVSKTPITKPVCGPSFDYYAYYPYQAEIENHQLPIDLASNPVNVMYSRNITGVDCNNFEQKNRLEFQRVLATVAFRMPTASGVSVVMNTRSKSTLNLTSGEIIFDNNSYNDFTLNPTTANGYAEWKMFVIPSTREASYVLLTVDGKEYKWFIPINVIAGNDYVFTIRKIDASTLEIIQSVDGSDENTYKIKPIGEDDPSERPELEDGKYFEVPVYAQGGEAPRTFKATHFIHNNSWLNNYKGAVPIRNYTVQFNTKYRYPEWVAYPLHPIYMATGNRTDEWQFDPIVPRSYQPDLSSGWAGKTKARGHVLPSASRNATKSLNSTTFYFTNMVAQDYTMNGETWEKLESQVRTWSKDAKYDTLYVVTGALLATPPEPIIYEKDAQGKESAIPKHLYKALLRKNKATGEYTSIGFKMENKNTGITYQNSVVSVEQLERESGYVFFPMLPDDIETKVKQQKDLSKW